MSIIKRIEIADLRMVREQYKLKGNFTAVRGEYEIPQIKKTGFYKINGCIEGAKGEEDLRELLSSRILEKIEFPHADILLAKDGEKNTIGCLSVNILEENEEFVEPNVFYKPVYDINDFIENDLEYTATIPGVTSEDLRKRKEFILKYLFISAFLSNTDVKPDNMFIIKNVSTGRYRNPPYYDMGLSFIENNDRKFFMAYSSNEIIEQLYEIFPSQVVSFGKKIIDNLNIDDVNRLLDEECYRGFSDESRISIKNQLIDRIQLISELSLRRENTFKFGVNNVHDATKNSDLLLRDRVSSYFFRIADRILGRESNDSK